MSAATAAPFKIVTGFEHEDEPAAHGPERDERAFPLEPVMALAPEAITSRGEVRSPSARGAAITAYAFTGGDDEPFERDGPLAVIQIVGPLLQYGGFYFDGYESIRARFGRAMSDPATGGVALIINSPGGVCAGCFEAVAAMRKLKAQIGKPVYAFADESAFSAGYAIACIADEVYLPEPGGVGSVGVVGVLADRAKANEAEGLNVVVIASGDQKADGHPDQTLSKEAIERYRDRTTALAGIFAGLVADARGKTTPEVLGLQAACLYGKAAVSAGLADGVKSRDQFLAYAQRGAKSALGKSATERKAIMGASKEEQAPNGGEKIEGTALAVAGSNASSFALAAGIRHDADEGAILGKIAELRSTATKVCGLTGKASMDEALGAIQAGQIAIGQLALVQGELAELRASSAKSEIEALIERGKTEGKITTPDMEAALRATGAESPTRLSTLLAALPSVVQPSKPTPEPTGLALSADELAVAKQMGMTAEAYAKGKAALALENGKDGAQ